jgi:hypothetical protein
MNKGITLLCSPDDSLKKIIIDILCRVYPLSINELHKLIRKAAKRKVSYQAVHKVINALLKEKVISKTDKKIQLSMEWIREMDAALIDIKKNYLMNNDDQVIIIKNHQIMDYTKEKEINKYLDNLVPMLKEAFSKHNIFKKEAEEVKEYLTEIQQKHMLIIIAKGYEIFACVVLSKEDEDLKREHARFCFRHIVFRKDLSKEKCKEYMDEIEKRLIGNYMSVNLEAYAAETELKYIEIFEEKGYERRAILKDRFRLGENAYHYVKTLRKDL